MAQTLSFSWKRLPSGLVVISKGNVHMSLNAQQVVDLKRLAHDILWDEQRYYKKDNRHAST